MTIVRAWRRRELLALAALVLALVLWRNTEMAAWTAYEEKVNGWVRDYPTMTGYDKLYYESTDEYYLLLGYRNNPDLTRVGLKWWTGKWMHEYTHYFRPVSSYLHWLHVDIGLKAGWRYNAWIGMGIFYAGCLLSGALAWRITRSKPAAVFAACLTTFASYFNSEQPAHWLAWYPMHPDLLAGALLLGATLCFDLWLERLRPGWLAGTWVLWLMACGVKEHAYIFPGIALSLALLRLPGMPRERRRRSLIAAASLGVAAFSLFLYRLAVVPEPDGPKWSRITPWDFVSRTLTLVYPAFYSFLKGVDINRTLFALLVYLQAAGWLRLRQQVRFRAWLERPFASVYALFGMIALAALSAFLTGTLIFFADPAVLVENVLPSLAWNWATFYAIYLFIVYRRAYPTALSWLLVYFAHLPIFYTNAGWYYVTIGWLFRGQYLALLAVILWDHWQISARAARLREKWSDRGRGGISADAGRANSGSAVAEGT